MNTTATRSRRGALLLLVLGVLTMFILMGTVMLTLATRTRTTARAFAAATTGAATGPMLAREQLNRALYTLLRGGDEAQSAGLGESLLGDMYGAAPPVHGSVTALQRQGPLIAATIQATGVRAADLCGRVITFTPHPESGDSAMSLRILRATGTNPYTLWMTGLQADQAAPLPRLPCDALVNQPAFVDEAYDAYDSANPWLTRVSLADGRVTAVPRPAFAAPGETPEVDNDNDGVKDGVWLENFFGSRPAPGGGRLEFDVSYLVLDLDGRINVNAHGSRTSIDLPGNWSYPDNKTKELLKNVPTGSGYGPADVDASLVFVDPLANNQVQTNPPRASDRWRRIIGDTNVGGLTATEPSAGQRRPVPLVGTVDGRYGASAIAGGTGNDPLSLRNETLYGTNPLVDLKCMIQVQMETGNNSDSAVPKMIYYCPNWTLAGYVDDPYEMRLDIDAPRPFELRSGTAHVDNPFTLADLEAVLRQFDGDAATLSPRLAAVLDNASQQSRMLVTTDSWDTPALTGAVAAEIVDYVASMQCDPAEVMSPDILSGLRFDVNRPFPTGETEAAAKQEYCKHLYTLLVALGQPADATTAQWAANVVDYRDTDSRFTRFQFDTTPADGWNKTRVTASGTAADPGWSDANVVWGAERPEVVIAQTLAWRKDTDATAGELYVSLHRPWNAELVQANGTKTPIDVIDPVLAGSSNANSLNLTGTVSNGPIWRLRFDDPSKFVCFQSSPNLNDAFKDSTVFTSSDPALMAPNSYLVVRPKVVSKEGIRVANGMQEFNVKESGFRATRWSGAGNDQPGSDTMVYLERLADPTRAWNAVTNPYVPVDQLGIKLVNRSGVDPNNWRAFFRDPPFWRDRPFSKIMNPPTMSPLDAEKTNWLPWANRAFISHAELLLVPRGTAIGMLSGYDIPQNRKATNPFYFLPTDKLLDATIVPSRFAGSQVSVDPATLGPVGMQLIPFNQFSRCREPGRVNLNTVLPNRNCSDPQRDDAIWWAVMGPDAAVSLDEFAGGGPATSIRDLLTLMQDEGIYIDSAADAGVKGNSWKKNRPYLLNPAAAYTTAIRLANVATIRSHVFAVWVTLRVRDTSPGGGSSYHRLFAIVDRSRPVGYSKGQDLNAREVIRVMRFLD